MTTHARSDAARGAQDAPQPAHYTEHFVQAGPVRLRYLDYGSAGQPPIVCVHGGAAHAHWFDFVAPGFNRDYRVISFDQRGHGDSDAVDPELYQYEDYASDLNAFVEALDLRDFVLIGHSMGGTVSLVYLANYPGRAAKFVMVDSTVNLSPERIAEMREVGSRPNRDYQTRDELISRFRLRPGNALATPEVIRYIAERSGRENPDGTWRLKFDRAVYGTRVLFDGMPLWERVRIPTLLVRGERSHRISPEIFAQVKARAPQAELVTVAAADHHVTLDNPQGFIDAVAPWLARS